MRRAAPTLPISPGMLRHFAVGTVIVTALVAVFADGESRDAAANAIKEREAKNQAMATNAAMFGAPKLRRRDPERELGTFGDEPGIESPPINNFTAGPSPPPLTGNIQSDLPSPPLLPMAPGASVTVHNIPEDQLITPQTGTVSAAKRRGVFRATEEEMRTIRLNSQMRSGNPNAVD